MIKPIMSPRVEEDVANVIVQFQKRDVWKKWGMDCLREQGPAVLLKGPSGTGKTTIAKYMAMKIKKGFKQLNVANLANDGTPGQTEKALSDFFADCQRRQNATIFIDECDHILLDRAGMGEAGKTWQLGTIEMLMMRMNMYRGLIICATNHPQSLDPALSDRFLAIIDVDIPDFEMRQRLWQQKIPLPFPLQFNEEIIKLLSKYELTGRQIETVIINTASNAIRQNKKPSVAMFERFCEREKEKHLDGTK